ncbi:MAG TPA: HesA/MoeB/ThiF family protein, partial [Puia sp.]|nr:HesA/MoeB/ThiF family protein [Puia sp.]
KIFGMDNAWARYECQLKLPGFGTEGQGRLAAASVLVAGAGGLGCPAALYLAAAGIGKLGIADYDTVSTTNLHRQVLYGPEDIGCPKSIVVAARLRKQNPGIEVVPIVEKIRLNNVMEILGGFDLVVDGTDNFETRYLLNDACVLQKKPFIMGSIYQHQGILSVLNVQNADGTFSPHYRDLFPTINPAQIPDCTEGGVMPTLAGMIGCMEAGEAIKYLIGDAGLLSGKMFVLDSKTMQSHVIGTGQRSSIEVIELPAYAEVPAISVDELREYFDHEKYLLIDVREKSERNLFHIGGRHIPLQDLDTCLSKEDVSGRVLFYCQTGRRSEDAARLASKKFPGGAFYSLEGGLRAWSLSASAITEKT